jgi:hypothetical protein
VEDRENARPSEDSDAPKKIPQISHLDPYAWNGRAIMDTDMSVPLPTH